MGLAETARLVAELSLDAKKFTAGFKGAQKSMDGLEKRFGKMGGIASRGASAAGRNIERGVMLGVGAAVAGIGLSVKAAGDFEAALNTINTVAQTTPTGLAGIGDSIREIARDTGTSVEDLGQAYYDLVSAGITTADATNVLTQANTLAIGGLSTTAEAVDLLTTAINSYGGDATKAGEYANMFAQAIGAGKVTAAELAASFATVGPIAADFGIGVDEISAALGVMTAKGTPAAEAFTQMRSAIVALKKPNATLAGFQKKLGIDFAKMAKKKGLAYAYDKLTTAAKEAGIPIEKLTGRVEGALFAAQVAGDNFAGYTEELDKVRSSSEDAGVAQEQADKRMQGFNYSMDRLKANVHDAAITIGTELLPQLADFAGEFSTFISEHQGDIKGFAEDLAGGFREAIDWAKKLDFAKIGDALKSAAGFAKGLIDAFLGMPTEVQGTILALGGLNKLTGGAVSGIVGELGKGLIKGILGMTAGVVNITAGVVKSNDGLPTGGGTKGGGSAGGKPGAFKPTPRGGSGNKPGLIGMIAASSVIVQGDTVKGAAGGAVTDAQLLADLKRMLSEGRGNERIGANETVVQGIARLEASGVQTAGQLAVDIAHGGRIAAAATNASSGAITNAIRSNRPIVTTNVNVNVSAAQVSKSVSVSERYGAPNGSRGVNGQTREIY